MGIKSATNGTNLVRGGKGYPPPKKLRKREEPKQEKPFIFKGAAIFSKIGGLNGWAFTEVLSTNVIKMT